MFDFQSARKGMVNRQLRRRGISDERVLDAMGAIPREAFVAGRFRERAYDDSPLDIGFQQTISQPYIVARMTEALAISPGDSILEIGTGCGYQTAVLASLAGEVYTIELLPELAERAQERLRALDAQDEFAGLFEKVFFRCADGAAGWPEAAPFDGILVGAAAEQAPPALLEQLAVGAGMLIPIGERNQCLYLFEKTPDGAIRSQELFDVRFVPLVQR